jgi:ankyrin repeat protein
MTTNDQHTTRWIRLHREAVRTATDVDGTNAPMVPFSNQSPAVTRLSIGEDDFGLERMVLDSWRGFFERFRPDETEFERPHYLAASQAIESRLARLGKNARPDLITCRMVVDLLDQFEKARFRDFNERIDELIDTCQQLKAQLDVAELSKCYQEDELQACQRMVAKELARREIHVSGPAEQVEPSPSAQLKALLLDIGAQTTATVRKSEILPADASALSVVSNDLAVDTHDVHARDTLEWTKLHSAAFYGKCELIVLLLDHGADINAKAKDGSTPLHLATKHSQSAAMKLLFARGGNLAAKDQEGNTPLHLAAELFTIDMLKVLVDMGAMVNARNHESWTPLHLAANRGKREVVEFLLGVGADINAVASNSWTPLKVAVNCGHLQLSEFIRSQGGHQ